MTREVLLVLAGHSTDETGEETVTEQSVKAQYSLRDGHHFLLYEEMMEGADTVTRNLIRLQTGRMELSKKGTVNTRMVFEPGKEHMTDYATPYGNLRLGLLTHSLDLAISREGLASVIRYSLRSGEHLLSECTMRLKAVFLPGTM